jgi:hypothetical protein
MRRYPTGMFGAGETAMFGAGEFVGVVDDELLN